MKLKYYLRGIGIGILVTATILRISNSLNAAPMSDEQVKKRAFELGMIENTVLKTDDNISANDIFVVDEDTSVSVNVSNEKESLSVNIAEGNEEVSSNIIASKDDSKDNMKEDSKEVLKDNKKEDSKENQKADLKETDKETSKDNHKEDTKDNVKEENNKDLNDKKDSDVTNSGTSAEVKQGDFVTVTIVKGDSSFSVAKKVVEAGLAESAAEFDQFLCENNYDKTLSVGTHRIPVDATNDKIGKILTSKEN